MGELGRWWSKLFVGIDNLSGMREKGHTTEKMAASREALPRHSPFETNIRTTSTEFLGWAGQGGGVNNHSVNISKQEFWALVWTQYCVTSSFKLFCYLTWSSKVVSLPVFEVAPQFSLVKQFASYFPKVCLSQPLSKFVVTFYFQVCRYFFFWSCSVIYVQLAGFATSPFNLVPLLVLLRFLRYLLFQSVIPVPFLSPLVLLRFFPFFVLVKLFPPLYY